MKTKDKIRAILVATSLMVLGRTQGQVSVPSNTGGPTDYVGWDSGTLQSLDIKHKGNYPIDFYTADRFRARINEAVQYSFLNNFTNIPADGFMLITPSDHFFNFNPKGPFSRLHLAEGEGDNAQAFGYRLWQRNGVTFTGNGDQAYIGQKYKGNDNTDFVVQWSTAPSSFQLL
ncbi:MAG: hypothetical protein KF843_07375 [Flavobacteriales bacterium]|nr:hypothetical protein [Flavobacteriales bacterium]